jgi:hypothetical protein
MSAQAKVMVAALTAGLLGMAVTRAAAALPASHFIAGIVAADQPLVQQVRARYLWGRSSAAAPWVRMYGNRCPSGWECRWFYGEEDGDDDDD